MRKRLLLMTSPVSFPALAWGVALLCGLGSACPVTGAEQKKPNIIVILADDLGYGDLGFTGGRDVPTPHIDSLVANGVEFTQGYVSGPYCSPTRAGLLTGRYQQRFGHEFNPGQPADSTVALGLSLKENPLPARLKAAGYSTGLVGKWHLGHAEQFQPPSRGFDEFFGFWGGAHSYTNPRQAPANPIVRGREAVDEKEYLTKAFAREAVAFIDRHKSEPFFLYYAFNAVHTPLEAPEEVQQKFSGIADPKRRTYAAMLSSMDDAIGAVLTKLDQEKLTENTLIFFLSDNGGPEGANASDNGPFRGQKAQTWEGGVHVPFVAQWKGQLPAGKKYEQPVIQLDILPTALAAAGVKAADEDRLDGVNLIPYAKGENTAAPHDSLYWRFGAQLAIRSGDWKLVKSIDGGLNAAARFNPPTLEGAWLVNLKNDPGEEKNLASQEPDIVKKLSAQWEAWNKELAPPAWQAPAGNQAQRRRAAQQAQQ